MLEEVKEHLASLNPKVAGCIDAIDNSESFLKLSELLEEELETDFMQFYSEFLGNEESTLGNFALGVTFHSLQKCLAMAEAQAENDMSADASDYPLMHASPQIDTRYSTNRSRVEIGSDFSTFMLCADYAPTKHGCFGQIIMVDFEYATAFVVSNSFSELVQQFSEDLAVDRYKVKSEQNAYWLDPVPEIDIADWRELPSRWSDVENVE